MRTTVNNTPDYAQDKRYWTCTLIDDELWFYGAFDNYNKALNSIEGMDDMVVVENGMGA